MSAPILNLDVRSTDDQRQQNGAVYPAIVDDGMSYSLLVDSQIIWSYGYHDKARCPQYEAAQKGLAREKCEAFRTGFVVAQLQQLRAA